MVVQKTEEFDKWLKKLRDARAKALIDLRMRRIKTAGNLGDHKVFGDGIGELRFSCGPGYRIYFAQRGDVVILLLNAGDKSTQQRDIDKARKLNVVYQRKGGSNENSN